MWGSKGEGQYGEDVHASYADPRAALLLGCLDQSVWTETVRLAAAAADICAWLASESNIRLDAASEYTAEWRRVSAKRYYYRGTKIATPWPSTA